MLRCAFLGLFLLRRVRVGVLCSFRFLVNFLHVYLFIGSGPAPRKEGVSVPRVRTVQGPEQRPGAVCSMHAAATSISERIRSGRKQCCGGLLRFLLQVDRASSWSPHAEAM